MIGPLDFLFGRCEGQCPVCERPARDGLLVARERHRFLSVCSGCQSDYQRRNGETIEEAAHRLKQNPLAFLPSRVTH